MKIRINPAKSADEWLLIMLFFFIPYTTTRFWGFKISEIFAIILIFVNITKISVHKNEMIKFSLLFSCVVILSGICSYFDPINSYVSGQKSGIYYSFEYGWIFKIIRLFIVLLFALILQKRICKNFFFYTLMDVYIASCIVLDLYGIISGVVVGGFGNIGIYRTSLMAKEASEAGFINCFAIICALFLYMKRKKKKYIPCILLMLIGQLIIGSTASLLAMFAAIGVSVFWMIGKKRMKVLYKVVLVSMIVLMIAISFIYLSTRTQILNKLLNYKYFMTIEGSSVAERLATISTCWEMFKVRPLLGIGFGNFGWYLNKYVTSVYLKFVPGGSFQPNNLYFELLAEVGVAGFAVYMFYLIGLVKKTIGLVNSSEKMMWGFMFMAILIYLFIHNFTLTTFYSFQFWIAASGIIVVDKRGV